MTEEEIQSERDRINNVDGKILMEGAFHSLAEFLKPAHEYNEVLTTPYGAGFWVNFEDFLQNGFMHYGNELRRAIDKLRWQADRAIFSPNPIDAKTSTSIPNMGVAVATDTASGYSLRVMAQYSLRENKVLVRLDVRPEDL